MLILNRNFCRRFTLKWNVTLLIASSKENLKIEKLSYPHYITAVKRSKKNANTTWREVPESCIYFMNYNNPLRFRYHSIRPGKFKNNFKVWNIRALKYIAQNGDIMYKIKHGEESSLLPQRKTNYPEISFEPLYNQRLKISKQKWTHLQKIKSVLLADTHFFMILYTLSW